MKKCNNDPSCSANPDSHLAMAGEDTCHGDGAQRDIQGFFVKYIWVICVSSLRVCSKQEDGSVNVGEVADLNQLDHLQDFDQLVLRGNDYLDTLREKIFCRLLSSEYVLISTTKKCLTKDHLSTFNFN